MAHLSNRTILVNLVADPRRRQVGFQPLVRTTTIGGRLIFHVFAALAEFVRELIIAGTREGRARAAARRCGHIGGRPTVMPPRR